MGAEHKEALIPAGEGVVEWPAAVVKQSAMAGLSAVYLGRWVHGEAAPQAGAFPVLGGGGPPE